jgi:hypothetical protein
MLLPGRNQAGDRVNAIGDWGFLIGIVQNSGARGYLLLFQTWLNSLLVEWLIR